MKYVMMACLLGGLAVGGFAQADVDSPYSLFGVGQLRSKTMNVRLKGMGGTCNAMMGGGLINAANPASYAKIDSLSFLFNAGFYFKSSTFRTSNLSEPSRNASFNHVSMAFGLFPWWKTALGVQPFSSAGYTMLVNRTRDGIGSTTLRFRGSGGLNQAFWGNGFKLGKHVAVGANVYYVFGNSQTETSLYFPDSSYYIGSRRNLDLMVNSFMFDYGLLFNTPVGNDMHLSLGLTYNQKVKLKGVQTIFVRSIEEDMDTEVEYLIDTIAYKTSGSKTTIPQGFGFGVALQKTDRWTFGADFNWMQWSQFAHQGVTEDLKDSWNVTVGAEFTPRHTSVTGYFSRVTYRFGGFFEKGFVCLPGNDGQDHNINKVGITAGLSLPLPRTLSKINVAFEFGQYGTRAGGLIEEQYVRMDVGVAVHELWFVKRKYK